MAGKNKRFPSFLTKKESDHSSNKKDDVGKVFVIKDQQLVVEEIIAEGWFLNAIMQIFFVYLICSIHIEIRTPST